MKIETVNQLALFHLENNVLIKSVTVLIKAGKQMKRVKIENPVIDIIKGRGSVRYGARTYKGNTRVIDIEYEWQPINGTTCEKNKKQNF